MVRPGDLGLVADAEPEDHVRVGAREPHGGLHLRAVRLRRVRPRFLHVQMVVAKHKSLAVPRLFHSAPQWFPQKRIPYVL